MNTDPFIQSKYFNLSLLSLNNKVNVQDIVEVIKKFLFNDNDNIDESDYEIIRLDIKLPTIFVYQGDYYCIKRLYYLILCIINKSYQDDTIRILHDVEFIKTDKIRNEEFKANMFNTIESIKTERYNYISLSNTTKNCYRISINTGKMFIDKIKNPIKFISMLNLQLKMLGLDYMYNVDKDYFINDMNEFKNLCDCIIHKQQYKYFNINNVTQRYVNNHNKDEKTFIPQLFEFFCSKRLSVPIYKYEPMEIFKLGRNDIGVDLFSTKQRIMVQCKCYRSSELRFSALSTFIEFRKTFPSYRAILAVNENCKFNKDLNQLPEDIEIVSLNDLEFQEFVNEFVDDLSIKYTKKTSNVTQKNETQDTIINVRPLINENLNHEYITSYLGDTELTFEGNEILKLKKFRGIEFSYLVENKFINLTRLGKFIGARVSKFMEGKTFYKELMKVDDSLTMKSNVYLIQFKDKKIVKIGRTYDPKKRYNKEILDNMVEIVPVENDTDVEKQLIDEFNKHFTLVSGTKESFYYQNFKDVMSLFKTITNKKKIDIKHHSKLIDMSKIKYSEIFGIYGHVDVASIIVHQFVTNKTDLSNFDKMFEMHLYEVPRSTFNLIYNEELGEDVLFVYANGYTFIRTLKTRRYNASRLINSIAREDGTNKSWKLLNRTKPWTEETKQFKIMFGNDGIYDHTNLRYSPLKGIYVDEYRLDTVLRYANARFGLMSNIFNRQIGKVLETKKSAEEKIAQIEELARINYITISQVIDVDISEDKFEIDKFISPETREEYGIDETRIMTFLRFRH